MKMFQTEKDCCGCAACAAVCPKTCIEMTEGNLGHLFPRVDAARCVDCGLCEQVCPMNQKPVADPIFTQKAYAAYAKDDQVRFSGSSGGMFEIFASDLLSRGYTVYGAAFDAELKLKCEAAKSEEAMHPLRKSKYLQSDLSGKFSEIREKLAAGEKVFITATPCQIAAVKAFLKQKYENLITCDFFCHGVPSQAFFDQCLQYDEKAKYGGKVTSYEFRTKIKNGATPHYYSVTYRKGEAETTKTGYYFDSTFYAFFQKYICLRESCYQCSFACRERCSDITIGDFHEIDRYLKGINRFDGISTVIANTEKGAALLKDCKSVLESRELDLNRLIADGTCFTGGTQRPKHRDTFVSDWTTMSTQELAQKYVPSKGYLKMRIYYALPKYVRNCLKKLAGE